MRSLYFATVIAWTSALFLAGCSKKAEMASTPPVVQTASAEPTPPASAPSSGGYGSDYNGGADQPEYKGSGTNYGSEYGKDTTAAYGGTDAGYGAASGNDGGYGGSDSSGYGDAYGGAGSVKYDAPLTLITAAAKAFEKGNMALAERFAKAAAFVKAEDRSSVMESVRWSSTTQQPELISQVAVGYTVDAPEGLTEYNPIFTSEAGTTATEVTTYGSMDAYGSGYGQAPSRAKSPEKKKNIQIVVYSEKASQFFGTELEKAAGLMASELIVFMNNEHAAGTWAPLFAAVPVAYQAPTAPSTGGGYGDSYGSGYGDAYGGGAVKVLPAKDDTLAARITEPADPRIAAEMTYIGHGKTNELIKKAKEAKFAALIVFEVVVKPNRRINFIVNECQAKLIHVESGKPVGVSKQLENRDVSERYADGDKEVVKKGMDVLLTKLKAAIALKEMPTALTSDLIKSKRLPNLVSDASLDKLDRLFELLLWKERKMLSEADYQTACETILGGELGSKLANGTEEEKSQIVSDLI